MPAILRHSVNAYKHKTYGTIIRMKTTESGFGNIVVLVTLIVVGIVGFTGWRIVVMKQTPSPSSKVQNVNNQKNTSSTYILSGKATFGPTTPGPCRDDSPNCSEAPLIDHGIDIYDNAGSKLATTKTDQSGAYSVQLKSGNYIIKLNPQVGLSSMEYSVTINSKDTTYDISADTGKR